MMPELFCNGTYVIPAAVQTLLDASITTFDMSKYCGGMVYSSEGGPAEQTIVEYKPLADYDFCNKYSDLCDMSSWTIKLDAACAST